ncbi:efflux transporter outer membrane subunit [Rurimicrobium arvi]|uniref:Efflux transporter outer membrane subunit n=2 Tax=Rurimicrobium arvi TaxID=2049916 RepID=A0ABP8MS28_9BACT
MPRIPAAELANVPAQYNRVQTTDSSSIADLGWNEFFTDPALQRLIRDGIQYNYDLQLALKRVEASQTQLRQAKLLQLPVVNAAITAQSSHPSKNSLNGISLNTFLGQTHIEDYNAAFNLSWEADIWGKLRLKKEAALSAYLQTYEAQRAVQTQIVAAIAQGYYNLLMLDEQLSVAHSNLLLNDTTLTFTKLQWDAGMVSSLAVQQAESQKQSVAILIPQLESAIAVQEHALSILTGKMPDSVYRETKLSEMHVNEQYATGVPAGLVSRRPDVRAQEMALRRANAQVGVAQREMYPSLTITAVGGLNSFKSSNWFEIPASLFGNVVGGLTSPVFQRGALKANLALAKNQREQAVLSFRQTVLQAVGDVSDALVQHDKLREQALIATAQVMTLKTAIRNAQLLYQSGMANYLEVMTVQGNALQAELNLALVRRQQLSTVVDLYRALGGGWK